MAGLTHLGVGMAAKRFIPNVPVGLLILTAYVIDILWGLFWFAGIERYPGQGVATTAPWSHGLFMAVIWSALTMMVVKYFSRNTRNSVAIGLLVFSHWLVDFIAKPMSHAFPFDSGLPLLSGGSPVVGLGLWGTATGEYIGEYGITALGIIIYVFTLVEIKYKRKLSLTK